jgi:flagellar hook-associated protein 2
VSSPISFSGFNNIDFQSIVNIMMTQASKPLTAMQTQLSSAQSKLTAYSTLDSQLSSVKSAYEALKESSAYGSLKVASSDSTVISASVTSDAVKGTHNIHVESLARPQVTASAANQFSDINADILDAGTFAITQNGQTTTIDLTTQGITTLAQLRDAINNAQTGVKAAVVNDGSGSTPFRLVLSSTTPGVANAFSVNDQTKLGTGAAGGVLNLSTDSTNGVAKDTVFTYNGISIHSTSTTISDAIPGLSLTLFKEGDSKITISDDSAVLKSKITAAVDAFNSFNTYAQSQLRVTPGSSTQPILYNDITLKTANRQLRDALTSNHIVSGSSFKNISEIGIQFDQSGKLTIDSTKLDDAIANHSADLQAFFSNATTGLATVVGNYINSFTKSGGAIDYTQERMQGSIQSLNSRITAMQAQLNLQKQSLTAQFAAADQAISQLNSQGNSLGSLSSMSWR